MIRLMKHSQRLARNKGMTMNLLDRFICAFERRNLRAERDSIYRNDLDVVAAGRLVVISA